MRWKFHQADAVCNETRANYAARKCVGEKNKSGTECHMNFYYKDDWRSFRVVARVNGGFMESIPSLEKTSALSAKA